MEGCRSGLAFYPETTQHRALGVSWDTYHLLKDTLPLRSYKDKFRKVVSWFSLRLDAYEKLLKSGVTELFFEKNGQGKFKKYTCSYG